MCVYIFVCWTTNINVYAVPFIALIGFLILLTCKDISPILILFFSVMQVFKTPSIDKQTLTTIVVCFSVIMLGIIINIIRFRPFRKGRVSGLLVACFAFGLAIALSGVTISNREPNLIIYTVLFGLSIMIISILFAYSLGLDNPDRRGPIKTVSTAIMSSALIASAQLLFIIFSSGHPVDVISGKLPLDAGYASSSYLANLLGRAVPIFIYLATRHKKYAFLWLWPAYICGIFILLLSQRMALLIAFIIAVIALVLFLKNIKVSRVEWVCTVIMLLGITFFFAAFMYKRFNEMFVQLFQQSRFENDVLAFWKMGLTDFANNPIFGAGFKFDPEVANQSLLYDVKFLWYRNSLIQSLGSFGLFGFICFGFVLYRQYQAFSRVIRRSCRQNILINSKITDVDFYGNKITVNKIDYLVIAVMLSLIFIHIDSLYDNTFFTAFDLIEILAISFAVLNINKLDNAQRFFGDQISDKVREKKK